MIFSAMSSKRYRFSDILSNVIHESSQFDNLAAELTNEERRKMLAKIRSSMESEATPISTPLEAEPPTIETHMQSLGFLDRIRLFLIQIFTGRNTEEVVQSWIMRSLTDTLIKKKIDGIDGKTRQFREAFAADVDRLKIKASVLAPKVEIASRRRTELVLGLAMHHFPGVHQELIRRTGESHIRSLKEESERYLKRQLTDTFEDLMADIPSSSRAAMTKALHQADALQRLATFSYAGILGSFEGYGQETGRHCAFDYVTRGIEQLQTIFSSLSDPIDLSLLETLVMLELDTEETRKDEHLFQQTLRDELAQIMEVLGGFRRFTETYPLILILKIIKDDPWWSPRPERSGEDWTKIYRTFILDRIHRMVLRVSLEGTIRKQLVLLRDVAEEQPIPIAGLPDGTDGVYSVCWYQGSAIKTLTDKLYSRVLPNLRIVLTGGEFYKSSNRAQFNDAYNEFEKVPVKIRELEKSLLPDGPWGAVLWGEHLIGEKDRMARRVDQDLFRVVEGARTTVEMLVNVLGGILYARPGSPYDTLANYGQLGGRRNAEVIEELKETHTRLQNFVSILKELEVVETRARENEIPLQTKLLRSGRDGGDAP